MGSLLNDWIRLFDENNFPNLETEPQDLRTVTMLFKTIQKEFQKVETAIQDKLQTYKRSLESKKLKTESTDDVITIVSSPEKNYKSFVTKENLLKSPTFGKHRKVHLKKNRKLVGSPKASSIFPLKRELFSPIKNEKIGKVLVNPSDEEDMFDNSTIICGTPDVSKGVKSLTSQVKKKHSRSHSNSTTLTQFFSGMSSMDDNKKDETTMMDIDEILERVENDEKIDPNPASKCNKFDSFVEDYDKLPERKKSPIAAFAYKETVRGNEKKKLKGWSCKECEIFYTNLKLSDEELEKRMNECSKHKSRFKPEDETFPGYWDLSLASSPEEEKSTQADSTQESENFDESTVFCFYKK